MKKNVLFIVVDSVTNDILFNKSCSKKVAPFLNKLRTKSISGDKMYSQAPFTEAALMSLIGSVDTLDNGGYMERMKNTKSVFEVFKENGYKTIFTNYYPSIYPSYMVPGIDEKRYIEQFQFAHIWEYRLKYFAPIYKEEKITDYELNMLIDMLEDNFKGWCTYLEKIKNNDVETQILNDCIDKKDIDKNIKLLKKEYNTFLKNKKDYIDNLFKLEEKHNLFKIKTFSMTDKIRNDEFRKKVIEKYKYIFDKIYKINFKRNLRNNRLPIKKVFKNIKDNRMDVVKGLLAGYKNSLFDKDLYERINEKYDLFKVQRSFNTVADEFFELLEKNKDNQWVSYIHIDDAHFKENFFTYDTDNMDIIDKEFVKINNFLNDVPKDYKGSITCDLSLMYVDGIIQKIYNHLEKENLLDNTSIVITADHGFSFNFCPVREKYVVSNYSENYNVPFIIWSKDIKPKLIKKFCTTKDISATLLELANIKIPKEFKGKGLINTNGQDYVTIEYMGGGCPDINRRPINLGVRTKEYIIEANLDVNIPFENQKLSEVYNLKKDPLENNNIVNKKGIEKEISKEIELLKNRFIEIQKQNINKK